MPDRRFSTDEDWELDVAPLVILEYVDDGVAELNVHGPFTNSADLLAALRKLNPNNHVDPNDPEDGYDDGYTYVIKPLWKA